MPTPIMGTKVSIGPCKHVRWTTPATTGAVSCLDCGLSKSAQQQDLDALREDVADQIAREGAGSTYSLTAGYVAYLVSLVPAALTQFVRQDGVVGALELRDKKVAECPDANLDPNKDCARCGASSNEGCRITALADAAFVHSVRATLSPTATTGLDAAAGWQPIETAEPWRANHPRMILAYWTLRGVCETYWDEDEYYDSRPAGWPSPREGWRSPGDRCIPLNQDCVTHWRPMPAPPALASRDRS